MDHQGQGASGDDEGGASGAGAGADADAEVDAWALLRASKRAIEALRREFGRVHAHDRAIGDENGAPVDRSTDQQADGE